MAFPTSVSAFNDPTSSDKLSSPSHSLLHQAVNTDLEAVETKLGTGSATPSSGAVLVGNGAGTSTWDTSPANIVLDTPTLNTPDLNGTELILDADADTSITADTDDQIDIRINGADDFRFTANKLEVLAGSTLEINATGALKTDSVAETTAATGVTIDGLLIKDGALATNNSVVSSNITADSVTDSKLVYGKIRSRQGGSATNWQTGGTTTYDYSATDTFFQVGSIASDASPKTITFPTAFNQNPAVFIQVTSASGANCYAHAGSISTTGFTCQVVTDGGAGNTAQTINWLAIGQ